MIDYLFADTDEEYRCVSILFKKYAAWLNIDLTQIL